MKCPYCHEKIRVIKDREYKPTNANTSDSNGDTMPFGKYKGMTFEEIYLDNPGYLKWVTSNMEPPITDRVAAYLESVDDELTDKMSPERVKQVENDLLQKQEILPF